jgi:uncharacterized protein
VLHLIPLPITKPLADNYLPAQFNHTDYPQLVAEGAPVDTIAVGSVMATFAWPPGHERNKKVARFIGGILWQVPALHAPPRHPKWKGCQSCGPELFREFLVWQNSRNRTQ